MNTFESYLLTVPKLRPKSVALYQFSLDQWQTWLQAQGLVAETSNYTHLLWFIQACGEKGYQKRYINGHLRAIRHYFNYLIQEQRIDYNPAANLHIRGVQRTIPHGLLDRDALDHLYEAYLSSNEKKLRQQVMLGLLVFQAVTMGELLQLHPAHIQLSKGLLQLPGGSRSEERTLKLEAPQMIPLQTYLSTLPFGQPLFTDVGNEQQLSNRLYWLMSELRFIHPGVKNASQLRQSVITEWLKVKDIRYVQQWAGHRYVSSTERYQTQDLATLQSDLNRFHPLQ